MLTQLAVMREVFVGGGQQRSVSIAQHNVPVRIRIVIVVVGLLAHDYIFV